MNPEALQKQKAHPQLKALEGRLGYSFQEPALLAQALTHKSYAHEQNLEDNERLEFLGDAILQFVMSDLLMERYPTLSEGELSKYRAVLVSENGLVQVAHKLDLGAALFVGKGEGSTGGRRKNSILADATEAVLAAVYLDSREEGGSKAVAALIRRLFIEEVKQARDSFLHADCKTDLQEWVQREKLGEISYQVTDERGPDHDKTFEVALLVGDQELGRGTGRSKKAAEQEAAVMALQHLRNSTP